MRVSTAIGPALPPASTSSAATLDRRSYTRRASRRDGCSGCLGARFPTREQRPRPGGGRCRMKLTASVLVATVSFAAAAGCAHDVRTTYPRASVAGGTLQVALNAPTDQLSIAINGDLV